MHWERPKVRELPTERILTWNGADMTRQITASNEIEKLKQSRDELVAALQAVFDLLEAYAPPWYTQEEHDAASKALAHANETRSPSSVRHRLGRAA